MHEYSDKIIDRTMHRLSGGPVSPQAIDALIARATALPQEKAAQPFWAGFLQSIATPGPFGLQQQALVLGLVAVVSFGGGIMQGYGQQGAAIDASSESAIGISGMALVADDDLTSDDMGLI